MASYRSAATLCRTIPVVFIVLSIGACSYPPYDSGASQSLEFRRWLEDEGELVEQFEIPTHVVGGSVTERELRYIPSMAVDESGDTPELTLDHGVVVASRWPDLELYAVQGGELGDSPGPEAQLSYASGRSNAWDVRPAIAPIGSGSAGTVAYYARTDDSEIVNDEPGFRFEIGTVSGLRPDSTSEVSSLPEPLVGDSAEQEERVLGIGLSPGALSVLFSDSGGAEGTPQVSLAIYAGHELPEQLEGGQSQFGNPVDLIQVDPETTLASEALGADNDAVARTIAVMPYENQVYSAVGRADPLAIMPENGQAGALLGSVNTAAEENAEYSTFVADAVIDGNAELATSIEEQEDSLDHAAAGFLSNRLVLGRSEDEIATYRPRDLGSVRLTRSSGSVHHAASLPTNYAELVGQANPALSGNESFVSYFTHVGAVRDADGDRRFRISVYAVDAEAFEGE